MSLIQIFWKTKTFFKKLKYHFLVETTKIENIISIQNILNIEILLITPVTNAKLEQMFSCMLGVKLTEGTDWLMSGSTIT